MREKHKKPQICYTPTRETELQLLAQLEKNKRNAILAGVDEVGRGALAGPVSVGIALINCTTGADFPEKLRDSKQISAKIRESLVLPCKEWVLACALGSATAEQINAYGIIGGLRIAASNAVTQLALQGFQIDGVLLDGSHDWWSANTLFETDGLLPSIPVRTMVKGDAQCAVVAAASVLAKVARDQYMEKIAKLYPQYDWEHNKGYASRRHIEALREYGPSEFHRTAWKLPGLDDKQK